jgi:hypothetical protein
MLSLGSVNLHFDYLNTTLPPGGLHAKQKKEKNLRIRYVYQHNLSTNERSG